MTRRLLALLALLAVVTTTTTTTTTLPADAVAPRASLLSIVLGDVVSMSTTTTPPIRTPPDTIAQDGAETLARGHFERFAN